MKVSMFDKGLLKRTIAILLSLLTAASLTISFIDLSWQAKLVLLIIILLLIIPIHIVLWKKANGLKSIILKINNSELEIGFGDIFKGDDNKVIPFNEYFDTSFENDLISDESLNGKYLKSLASTDTLDYEIENLPSEKLVEENTSRANGKKKRYRLGTILKRTKYFLLAFSRFDDNNKAYLTQNDYVACLLNMWSEIDKIYNQKTVCIPLLGSGITRIKDNTGITDQELLSIMIWSFRISKVKFAYPSKVKIVLYAEKADKINLFKIKENN